jgi:1-acyl-sn-glycerol-3-phosphate acyltransferase
MNSYIINFSLSFQIASFIVYYITLFFVIIFDHIFFNIKIIGRNNLNIRKAILISNHTLYLDPGILSHAIMPRRTYFSAMEKTFNKKILGTYIRLLGAFPLKDNTPLLSALKQIKRAIDKRGFIHIFPEGELYHYNQKVKDFKNGAFYLSFIFNIPVIPIALLVKQRSFLGKKTRLLPPKVIVLIEKPLFPYEFNNYSLKEEKINAMKEKAQNIIQNSINLYNN